VKCISKIAMIIKKLKTFTNKQKLIYKEATNIQTPLKKNQIFANHGIKAQNEPADQTSLNKTTKTHPQT
tara:strand:+ start:165 stop:371 length:207 start_codon:yes stop_codon:yes gene_type:complete